MLIGLAATVQSSRDAVLYVLRERRAIARGG